MATTRKIQSFVLKVDDTVALASVRSRQSTLNFLATLSQDVTAAYIDAVRGEVASASIWICAARDDSPGSTGASYKLTGVDIRLDIARSPYELYRHFIIATIKILTQAPGNDLPTFGPQFDRWLLNTFAEIFSRDIADKLPIDEAQRAMEGTRLWVYSSPDELYKLAAAGTIAPTGEVLPEAKEAFMGSAYIYGRPWNCPPEST